MVALLRVQQVFLTVVLGPLTALVVRVLIQTALQKSPLTKVGTLTPALKPSLFTTLLNTIENFLIMAYSGLTVEYTVKTTGDRLFIPVNAPDATKANQLAQCIKVSPDAVEKVAT